MAAEKVDTLVVGGGQAGIAMSEHLGRAGVSHVVLERARIAERWRTERWDSLVANGPAWHDRFPGLEFPDADPDAFVAKDDVAEYFVKYAEMIDAPVRCGVEVKSVRRIPGSRAFHVVTSAGAFEAKNVVAATGPFQKPIIPPVIPAESVLLQIHSNGYRNPEQLPEGGVLVVGAGSSGVQIADELSRSGRKVWLSVGPHDRPPRSYRGRDFVWWLGVLGKWDIARQEPGREHVTIAVSGARGGETIDFRRLAQQGITLLGRTESFENGTVRFAGDVATQVNAGDANYLSLLDEADAYVERMGLDLPEEPEARQMISDPECLRNPVTALDAAAEGVTSVIWATGYGVDYGWLEVDTFDEGGRPRHLRGISDEPGVYFLGLPWQSRRGSSFIWGVWHDAKHIADHILTQASYFDYNDQACARAGAEAPVKAVAQG
jgi:putative flavoprotein involved in K+ transport